MIAISWIIERLLVKPTEGSYTDVVITADWRCNGSETTGTGDDAKTYSGTCYGSCSFAAPTGSFTPYPDLTQEQVFPQLVDQWADEAPEGEAPYKSVRQDLIPVLVKAIQELAAEVNALKNA